MVQYLTPFTTNDIVDIIINQIPVSMQNIECTPELSTTETDALEPINDADLGCLCIHHHLLGDYVLVVTM